VGFASAEIKAAGGNDVFVAFDDHWGVRLEYDGGGRCVIDGMCASIRR